MRCPHVPGELNLLGSQWGMMNETGAYPGQAWLWLYTFWYQVPFGPYQWAQWRSCRLGHHGDPDPGLIFVPYIPGSAASSGVPWGVSPDLA